MKRESKKLKKAKNPLAMCFGLLLRKCRIENKLSYDDIYKTTGISASYFQACEKANALFHVNNAYSLYKICKPNNYTLDGILSLLGLVSMLEDAGNERLKYSEKLYKTGDLSQAQKNFAYLSGQAELVELLRNESYAYRKLFALFVDIEIKLFTETNTDVLNEILIEFSLINEVENYLVNPVGYGLVPYSGISRVFSRNILDMPSLYLDTFLSSHYQMSLLPKSIGVTEIIKWVKEHLRTINEVEISVRTFYHRAISVKDSFFFSKILHPLVSLNSLSLVQLNVYCYDDRGESSFDDYNGWKIEHPLVDEFKELLTSTDYNEKSQEVILAKFQYRPTTLSQLFKDEQQDYDFNIVFYRKKHLPVAFRFHYYDVENRSLATTRIMQLTEIFTQINLLREEYSNDKISRVMYYSE